MVATPKNINTIITDSIATSNHSIGTTGGSSINDLDTATITKTGSNSTIVSNKHSKKHTKQQYQLDSTHFDKLVQQILKKFTSSSSFTTTNSTLSSGTTSTNNTTTSQQQQVQRPCDVASIAIGKELGYEYWRLLLIWIQIQVQVQQNDLQQQQGEDPNQKNWNQQQLKIWNTIQESILYKILSNDTVNCTISSSFFDILLSNLYQIQRQLKHRRRYLNKNNNNTKNSSQQQHQDDDEDDDDNNNDTSFLIDILLQVNNDNDNNHNHNHNHNHNNNNNNNNNSKNSSSTEGYFNFLSDWLLQIEQITIQFQYHISQKNQHIIGLMMSSSLSSLNTSLSSCIRTFSYQYVMTLYNTIVVCSTTNSTNYTNFDIVLVTKKTNSIIKTHFYPIWSKIQMRSTRIALLNEMIHVTLFILPTTTTTTTTTTRNNGTSNENTTVLRSACIVLSQLLVVLMLETSVSTTTIATSSINNSNNNNNAMISNIDKGRILSSIHTKVLSIWKQYQDDVDYIIGQSDDNSMSSKRNSSIHSNNMPKTLLVDTTTSLSFVTKIETVLLTIIDCTSWIVSMTNLLVLFLDTQIDSSMANVDEVTDAITVSCQCTMDLLELSWFPMHQIMLIISEIQQYQQQQQHDGSTGASFKSLQIKANNVYIQLQKWISNTILRTIIPKLVSMSTIVSLNPIYCLSSPIHIQMIEYLIDYIRDINEEYIQFFYYDISLLLDDEKNYVKTTNATSTTTSTTTTITGGVPGAKLSTVIQVPPLPMIIFDTVTALRICTIVMVTPSSQDRIVLFDLLSILINNHTVVTTLIASDKFLQSVNDTAALFVLLQSIVLPPSLIAVLRTIAVQFAHDDDSGYGPSAVTLLQEIDDCIPQMETLSSIVDDHQHQIHSNKIQDDSIDHSDRIAMTRSSFVIKQVGHNVDIEMNTTELNLIDLIVRDWRNTVTTNEIITDTSASDSLLLQNTASIKSTSLIDTVAVISTFEETFFTPVQQAAALLFGISLLESATKRGIVAHQETAYTYLHRLLVRYQHLSISLVPVIVLRINQASLDADGQSLLRNIQFMCTSLVSDPQTAQEVWNLVGVTWMNPNYSPLNVRIALIRFFPYLIEGNKRLYRRVIDFLVSCLGGKELGIRLAAASSIADLAKNDCIRDVADVIGHLQGLLTSSTEDTTIALTPIHTLLVHSAILTLHYLVVSDELDFAVVIQVLKKKLCPITDLSALLKLPPVVLESFVMLLGDGECGVSNSDDELANDNDNTGKLQQKPVPSHVQAAVQALIHIINFVGDDNSNHPESDAASKKPGMPSSNDKDVVQSVKMNAYQSLARYSLAALGVTEDGLNACISLVDNDAKRTTGSSADDAGERYMDIRDVILDGLENIPNFTFDERTGSTQYKLIQELADSIVKFEEETLGSALWQKKNRKTTNNLAGSTMNNRRRKGRGGSANSPHHALLSLLPSKANAQELLHGSEKNSTAYAIVQLLTCDGSKLSELRDNADNSLETSDPIVLTMAMQGFLQAASSFVTSKVYSIKTVIDEITSWLEILVSADAMYLALCALCVYIPHDKSDDVSSITFVEDIYKITMDSYISHGFHNSDIGNICLGMLGVSTLRYAEIDCLTKILDMLEHSVSGYGGQQSFGAFYAISMIARSAVPFVTNRQSAINPNDIRKQIISRATGFILETLLTCFEVMSTVAIHGLVACVKSGYPTSDLVQSISKLESDSIAVLVSREKLARELFICCAMSMPSLAVVNDELLVSVIYLLDSLEWGSGKGFALQSVLVACGKTKANAMTPDQLQDAYSGYVNLFEGRTDNSEKDIDSRGIDEIFYTLNGSYWKPTPTEVVSQLIEHHSIFDKRSFEMCLLALVNSMSNMFCNGTCDDVSSLGQLDSTISEDNLVDLIDKLTEMIKVKKSENTEPESVDFGSILLGFLSSIKDIQSTLPDETEPQRVSEAGDSSIVDIDFSKLPRSTNGTLISGIIDTIERLLNDRQGDRINEANLERAISCLNGVSVPGNYALSLVQPLIRENIAQPACIHFLCSQVSGRRRVYVEGQQFLALITKYATDPSTLFFQKCGDGTTFNVFLEQFQEVIPKIHLDTLNQAMKNVWERCATTGSDISTDQHVRIQMVRLYLVSVRNVLSSRAPSFKVMSAIRLYVMTTLFDDIVTESVEDVMSRSPHSDSESIIGILASCFKEIPQSLLEENNFFVKSSSRNTSVKDDNTHKKELFRIAIILQMIQDNYFDTTKRGTQELTNAFTWISKQIVSSSSISNNLPAGDVHGFLRILISYTTVHVRTLNPSTSSNSSSHRDILSSIFDILLLTKDTAKAKLGLVWLGIVVSRWCNGNGSDADLSMMYLCSVDFDSYKTLSNVALDQYVSLVLKDFPYHLLSIIRQEKISSVISNYLYRFYDHWMNICTSNNDSGGNCDSNKFTIALQRAIILEKGSTAANYDAFVSIATSTFLRK